MITAPGHVLGSAVRDAVVESCALAWHNHQAQLGPGWKRLAHERLTAPARRRTPPRSAPAPQELFDSYSIATRTPAPRSPAHHSCFSPACKSRKGRLQRATATHCSTARRGARKGRFVPDERRSLRPAESFGHAMLTCSGPANAGSTNGSLGLCCINLAISRATARWKHLRWGSERPGKRLSDIPAS